MPDTTNATRPGDARSVEAAAFAEAREDMAAGRQVPDSYLAAFLRELALPDAPAPDLPHGLAPPRPSGDMPPRPGSYLERFLDQVRDDADHDRG